MREGGVGGGYWERDEGYWERGGGYWGERVTQGVLLVAVWDSS